MFVEVQGDRMKVYGFVRQPSGNNTGPDALLLRALNGRLTGKDLKLFFGEATHAGVAGFMLTRLLRILVDAWLESGKRKGQEYPWERQPWREPLEDYISRNPPLLMFSKDDLGLLIAPIEHRGPKRPSRFTDDFEEAILSMLPDKQSLDAETRKVLHSGADSATALYLQLVDSITRVRLFHCDGCGVYFMRTRNPKRDKPIERGTFCANCKGKGGARRTVESRKLRTQKKIGWAADAWEKWKPNRRHGNRSLWVVMQVNTKLPPNENAIKTNWVTRHQTEIKAEVERRNSAKG
jgi:hypothetical protein